MTDQLWAGTIGQAVRDMYAYAAEGLPQQEPLFDLKQIPPEVFSGFAQSSRSVLWVGIRDQTNVRIDKNTYAKPQTVAVFTAPTPTALTEIIVSQSDEVIKTLRIQERAERLRRIRKSTFAKHGLDESLGLQLRCRLPIKRLRKMRPRHGFNEKFKKDTSTYW